MFFLKRKEFAKTKTVFTMEYGEGTKMRRDEKAIYKNDKRWNLYVK